MVRRQQCDTYGCRCLMVGVATVAAVLVILISVAPAADSSGIHLVDLTSWFNNDGISTRDHLDDGNFTEGILYPAEGLPDSGEVFQVDGIAFRFPPKEARMLNNLHCRGQLIDLPDRPAAALYFLGASDERLFDRQAGQDSTATTVTLHYVDGEREEYTLRLNSWWSPQPSFGNRLALRTEGFHVQNRISQRGGVSLFAAAVYPRRSVSIDSIRLGDDEAVHIFALTLSGQPLDNARITVDRLDWGSRRRPGDTVATASVRALSDVADLRARWTLDDKETREESVSLAAGQSRTLSCPYHVGPADSVGISLEITDGEQVLYAANGSGTAPPRLSLAMSQRVFLRQPVETLAHWRSEQPDPLADDTGTYPLSASAAWSVENSFAGLNPVPGTGETNVSTLTTTVADLHSTWYTCSGKNPLDAIGADAFVVEGFGCGGGWGGHDWTALDCRSADGTGILVKATDMGTRFSATVRMSDGSRLTAHSKSLGRGDMWKYFAVVRAQGQLKFFVRGLEEGQPLILVETVSEVSDVATVDTAGADWKFGGGPWFPSFDQYRVTRIPADRKFTLLTGDEISVRGMRETTGRVDAFVKVDVAELNELSLHFELTDADGNNPRRIATVEEISPAQLPYELVTTGELERARSWPPGYYVPATFSLNGLDSGSYQVHARLLRGDQEIARAQTPKSFAKVEADASPTNVSFDPDGTMVVDGQRVFPVGIISGSVNEQILQDIARAGFNFVMPAALADRDHFSAQRAVELLDACAREGLLAILELKNVGHPLQLRSTVLTFRDHPALIGWHLFEEPVYMQFTLAEIDATWRELKRLDPYHFFDLIDWSYSTLERYAPWSSPLIPDRYPIGHTPKPPFVESIRAQVEAAHQAAKLRPKAPGGEKPVWICLQAENFNSDIKRAPTATEERAQAYEAIVAGVRGMVFYEYHCARRDQVWEPIARVAAELKQLEPVLVDPSPVRQAECDGPIDTWLKRHDGHEYLIAVNREDKPVQAKVTIPGASSLLRTEVLFEDRDVDTAGADFTDDFEPYGVHVYKIEADTTRAVHEVYAVYPYSGVRRENPGLVRQESPISVSLAGGEFEPVCLVVDNRHPDADTIDFLVEVKSELPAERLRLARLAYMAARARRGHPTVSSGDVADAIIPLSQFEPVTVAAGECRHLWLTVDGRGLEPGGYSASVVLRPLTADADRRERDAKGVDVKIRVWPFVLPKKTPITVFTWDMNVALKDDAWLSNFVEHRFNTFLVRMDLVAEGARVKLEPDGTLGEQPDFSDLTARLLRGKPHARLFMFALFPPADGGGWPCTDGTAKPYNSPEWRKGFTEWFGAFTDYLEGLGIGTDQWVWYPFDEAFPGNAGDVWNKALQQAKLVHEINPDAQFFMDCWSRNAGQLEPWRGLNVIWCPDYGIYGQAPWNWLKDHQDAQQRPMWMYSCHEGTRGHNPHSFYRCRGWLSWIYGLDGMSYWNVMVHAASPWNDLDYKWGDNSVLLSGEGGSPINTLRHDAYRDGIEDYLYVHMLDELLSQPGVDAQTVKEGRELLKAASEEYRTIGDWAYLGELKRKWRLTEEIAVRTQAQRKQIAELIVELNR
jgi:hypothetical protein